MSRVALATSAALPQLDEDGPLLLEALAAAGVDATPRVWDDPSVDWAGFDLVVVRSTWDYTDRREDFLAWARSVPRLANPAAVLAWNTDKRYLGDLAEAGVRVVPTTYVGPGDAYRPPPVEHVVKPTVSAGARDTARYAAGESSVRHVSRLLREGREAMVQPYLPGVDEHGETAVLLFLGELSHGARKAPVLVPGLADPDDVEVSPRDPSPQELSVAEAALAAVPTGGPLLYARVDLLPGPDGPVVVEVELTEPSLFLGRSPGAADRFADAVSRVADGLRRAAGPAPR